MSGEGEFGAHFEDIVDLICLVYHEARNVRHPIKKGYVPDADRFSALINLPTGRNPAWLELAGLRTAAAARGDAAGAGEVFERRFGVSLGELEALYARPIWKHSLHGGNKWVAISAKVRELVDAARSGDVATAGRLCREVVVMRHNTGSVVDKLAQLRSL